MLEELSSGLATLGSRLAGVRLLPATPAEDAAAPRAIPRFAVWPVIRQAALLWLASRAAFVLFTYVAVPFNAQGGPGKLNTTSFPPHTWLDQWNRWDTQWYTGIALQGYHDVYTTAFFPFFPFLIHLATILTGATNAVIDAIIISNLATLAAFVGLGLLAAGEFGPDAAPHAVRALAAFPLAFFLTGGYSDSVFLAFAIFSLFFARRGLWPAAAACAALASLTRLFGLVLILPLAWEWIRQYRASHPDARGLPQPRSFAVLAMLVLSVPAALAAWGTYLGLRFGDPFSYFTIQRTYWDHYPVPPWQWFKTAWDVLDRMPGWSYPQVRVLFDLAPVVLVLILTLLAIRQMPLSFALYMLGTLFICLTSSVPLNFDPFTGQGRYMLMSAPIFLLLGRWMAKRPGLDLFVVGAGFMLQGLFTAVFLRGGWLV